MKKTVFVLVAVMVLLVSAVSASAELRLDLDVNIPVWFGYSVNGAGAGTWNQYFIPFPDARIAWQFGEGLIDGGVGIRAFTFIIENILWPEGFIELNVDHFTFSASAGGFVFLEFGLLSSALQSAGVNNLSGFHGVLIPDLNAAWRVTDWFRLGVGVFMIAPFGADIGGVLNSFVYSGYINARFVIRFK
jgi:hypothetical protein